MAQALATVQQLAPISITKPAIAIGLTTVLLTLGGFVVLATAAFNLAQVFQHPDPILALLVLGIATILISDIMLIRLLSRIVRSSLDETGGPVTRPATQGLPSTEPEARLGSQRYRTHHSHVHSRVQRENRSRTK
jgi:hypothetical protein